jgi:D-glycero-D-manno-heptose 1,7-bisphosphate phosphatase
MKQGLPTVDVRNLKIATALCLDLDGTIRYSRNGKFINKPEDITLFEGVESKLWEFREKNILIVGLSNQGGVAFGIKSPQQEMAEIDVTLALFERNPFHIVKCCWHHEKGKVFPFNYRSLHRKPDIGMLAECETEAFADGYVIDWNNSLFVGDRPEDEECAKRAGIAFQWAWDFFGRPRPEGES